MRRLIILALMYLLLTSHSSYSLANSTTYLHPSQDSKPSARNFDSFGTIGYEDLSARLDNFVISLQNEPDADGYVISYGPQGEGSGTGNCLLRNSEIYLSNRGIAPERIRTIYGGRFEKLTDTLTELWIVPHGAEVPEPRQYKNNIDTISGKFDEYAAWEGFEESEGPSSGDVTLAAFADALTQQSKTVACIVAYSSNGAVPGIWRRIAKREAEALERYGVKADRVKIIFGGTVKRDQNEDPEIVSVQLWILPPDAPAPITQAEPESAPKEAVEIGYYNNPLLKYPKDERSTFEGFADVLRANKKLGICFIVHPGTGEREADEYKQPDEPPDIDVLLLVEKWKSELVEKCGIAEEQIVIIRAATDETYSGTIDVWIVPPGASLPDPSPPVEIEQQVEDEAIPLR